MVLPRKGLMVYQRKRVLLSLMFADKVLDQLREFRLDIPPSSNSRVPTPASIVLLQRERVLLRLMFADKVLDQIFRPT